MVFINGWILLGFGLLMFYVLYQWTRLDFKNNILDHENRKLRSQLQKELSKQTKLNQGGEKLK